MSGLYENAAQALSCLASYKQLLQTVGCDPDEKITSCRLFRVCARRPTVVVVPVLVVLGV